MSTQKTLLLFLLSLVVFNVFTISDAGRGRGRVRVKELKMKFYQRSCPQAEDIVRTMTWDSVRTDPGMGAKLLRMHYHDCFVRGCDGSILLDTVNKTEPSEKEAVPNRSLLGFDVIESIKSAIEKVCPGIVSCSDILALSARDAVSFNSTKPKWLVPTGRRDGRISLQSEVSGNLPSPFSNFTTLMKIFTDKGLDVHDLVTLSAAHTIGIAHCGAVSRRLYNFTGKGDADPSLDKTYADFLRTKCPNPANPATTLEMDPESSLSFDKSYFSVVLQNKGLFQSDAALLTDPEALETVKRFEKSNAFFWEFSDVMQRMGAMDVLLGARQGEIRKKCNVVNKIN